MDDRSPATAVNGQLTSIAVVDLDIADSVLARQEADAHESLFLLQQLVDQLVAELLFLSPVADGDGAAASHSGRPDLRIERYALHDMAGTIQQLRIHALRSRSAKPPARTRNAIRGCRHRVRRGDQSVTRYDVEIDLR